MITTNPDWNPPSLQNAVNNRILFEMQKSSPIKKSNKKKYMCHCGCWCWDFQLFDVRAIKGIKGSFICDGCYSKLERNLVDIDGAGKPANTKEFKQRYLKAQGASLELQNKVGTKYDANNEIDNPV